MEIQCAGNLSGFERGHTEVRMNESVEEGAVGRAGEPEQVPEWSRPALFAL